MSKVPSPFKITPHKYADGELFDGATSLYALQDVRERETGDLIGMINPVRGGYAQRTRTGELFDVAWGVSRDVAAGSLRAKVQRDDAIAKLQSEGVAAGCPNDWHKTSAVRASTACPECPTQPGLKHAIAEIRKQANILESGGDDPSAFRGLADDLEGLLYDPNKVTGRPEVRS